MWVAAVGTQQPARACCHSVQALVAKHGLASHLPRYARDSALWAHFRPLAMRARG